MHKDYYTILGVPRDAHAKQIKSAYRNLAKQWHPDLNNNSKKSEEQFKIIAEAYNIISNPGFRKQYNYSSQGRSGRSDHPSDDGFDNAADYGYGEEQNVIFSMDDMADAAWIMAEYDIPWIKIGVELHRMGCCRSTAYKIALNVTRDITAKRAQDSWDIYAKWFYGAGAHACLFFALNLYF